MVCIRPAVLGLRLRHGPSPAVSLWYSESSVFAFAVAISVCLAFWAKGLTAYGTAPAGEVTNREGIAITALGWIMVMFFWAWCPMLPAAICLCWTAYSSAFPACPARGRRSFPIWKSCRRAFLLWRSLTHWFGGLGIIVIFIALFPQLGRGTVHMFNAEHGADVGPERAARKGNG